jgi:hypothetical protein
MFCLQNKIILLIPVILLLSCKQATQPAYQSPYEQWRALNLHDYTIDQSRECFCINGGEAMRVTVRADTVASVKRISNDTVISKDWYYSIDTLFWIIQHGTHDSLVVKYNSRYGYPEFLDIDPQMHPFDGGVLYQTSNLQIP